MVVTHHIHHNHANGDPSPYRPTPSKWWLPTISLYLAEMVSIAISSVMNETVVTHHIVRYRQNGGCPPYRPPLLELRLLTISSPPVEIVSDHHILRYRQDSCCALYSFLGRYGEDRLRHFIMVNTHRFSTDTCINMVSCNSDVQPAVLSFGSVYVYVITACLAPPIRFPSSRTCST
jgi:hypothetical protein